MLNDWTAVAAEFENQLRFDHLFHLEVERRNRTTIQCQRLLPDLRVALATPATMSSATGGRFRRHRRINVVIAFTSDGPWLFEANKSNPGLPRKATGPIDNPSPISLAPHDREGGTLTIGESTFIVPYLHAAGVRQLIVDLASLPDEQDSDGGLAAIPPQVGPGDSTADSQ